MKLFYSKQTRSSRIVWLLEEAGIDYEMVPIEMGAEDQPADFLAASPLRKVPAIEDGDVAMADSAAIAIYVSDRYPNAGLGPSINDPLRGQFLFWTMYTPAVLEPAMAEKISGAEPNPRSHGWGSFDLMIETLERQLSPGPWLLGDQFSAADIVTGSSVVYLRMFGMLPESELLNAYADRCLERPAYQAALQMDQP